MKSGSIQRSMDVYGSVGEVLSYASEVLATSLHSCFERHLGKQFEKINNSNSLNTASIKL